MKQLLSATLIVISFTAISFAQWFSQTSGTTEHLYDVYFTNLNTGTAVGTNGTINGGTTWVPQSSGTAEHWRSVSFIDEDNGIVVGTNGTII